MALPWAISFCPFGAGGIGTEQDGWVNRNYAGVCYRSPQLPLFYGREPLEGFLDNRLKPRSCGWPIRFGPPPDRRSPVLPMLFYFNRLLIEDVRGNECCYWVA